MAIGDAVAVFLGTGTVNRQPAAGVEEQISCIVKSGVADAIEMYDGTNVFSIISGGDVTNADLQAATQTGVGAANMALMITNSIYIRKAGTTDRVYLGGVQTNA